jgi:hypothetical protein
MPGIFFACSLGQALAQAPDHDKLLRQLHQSYHRRLEQQNPIWVQFSATVTKSVPWQQALRNRKAKGERRLELDAEYARKGLMTRTWARRQSLDGTEPTKESFKVYNGRLFVVSSNKPNAYLVSATPDETQQAEPPLERLTKPEVEDAIADEG